MRSAGCALFPTNGAAPPPAEACWEEGSEGEGSEGEGEGQDTEGEGSEGEGQGSDGQGQVSEDEEAEVCSPTPPTTPGEEVGAGNGVRGWGWGWGGGGGEGGC